MRTLVIGCNHRSAPLALRERLAFDEQATRRALATLRQTYPAAETVVLSTCNRTEIYVARPPGMRPQIDDLIRFVAEFHGLQPGDFAESIYTREDSEAVRHLFRVASSLDSMVIGETQVLGQTRHACELARAVGTAGRFLDALFQQALGVAKEIHSATGIATGRFSVGSTAVDFARRIFARFDDKTVMMVGAGEMGELTLTHLLGTGTKRLLVTNRTDARAVELADRLAQRHGVTAEPVPYAEWIDRLAGADIVITSTGSREPILSAEAFQPVPARRRYRPLLIIDIAVPRDVEPAVGEHDCVFLYNIDDLQSVIEANAVGRREALARCHAIIEAHVVEFVGRHSRGDIGPLVDALRGYLQGIGENELNWLLPKLEGATDHDCELIRRMLHRLTQKLLHGPVRVLNEQSDSGAAQVYADMLKTVFKLDAGEPQQRPSDE